MTAPEQQCTLPGCGALAIAGKPCRAKNMLFDHTCPQYWVHHEVHQQAIAAAVLAERERCAAVARGWTKHNVFSGIGEKKRFDAKDVQQSVRTATILCADDIMKGPDND